MKKLFTPVFIAILIGSFTAQADESYNHFPAVASTDIHSAFCNIQSYNQKLTAITSKQTLSAQDMVKVHELTYTLENALKLLKLRLDTAAEELEKVHIASEKLEQNTIQSAGNIYLSITTSLLTNKQC